MPAEAPCPDHTVTNWQPATFFFAPPQNVSHMPLKTIEAKIQLRDFSIYGPLIVVLVK